MIHLVVLPVDNKLLLSFAGAVCSQGYSTVFPATNFFNALLRIVPRTGAIVTEIEFHKMRHVFQIRAEIEDLAGRLAAENINPTQLNGIEKLVQACEKLAKMPQNSKKLIELDLKFRDILYEAADNPVLKDQSQHLYHLTLRLTATLFNTGDWSDLVRMSHDEYKEIHQALTEKDAKKAGDLRRKWLGLHLDRIKLKF
ncbi:MAG: GntR family transcriptional regulator [Desulfobacterales bacterium]